MKAQVLGEVVESERLAQRLATHAKRATFRRMPANLVRALNRINKPRKPLTFHYGDKSLSMTPVPLGPALVVPYRVALGPDNTLGPIDIDRYLVKRFVGMLDAELAESDLEDDALELALSHVLAEPLRHFEHATGQTLQPKLVSIEPSGHEDKTALDFEVSFDGDQGAPTPARARFWLPVSSLPEFSLAYDRVFQSRPNNLKIFLPMHLQAGTCRLPLQELRRLRVGDVLMVEDKAAPWPSAWLIVAGKRRVAVQIGERKATIIGRLEHCMTERPEALLDDGSVDDLEVDVRFELGRAHMPLRQLQLLAEGGVIPLERDYASPVDVVVGGRRVGEGEIVDIDGRIGVRLVRFSNP